MAATWDPAQPPGPVTHLSGDAVNSDTAHLSWQAPSDVGSGIGHFEVTSTLVGGSPKSDGDASATNTTVTKLQPGGVYRMKVTTVATDGQTSSAAEVTVTMPAVKPSAAKITRVVGISSGLRVYWSAPKSTGGAPITSYKLAVDCKGAAKTERFGGSTHEGTMGGLPAGKTCTARVTASNRVGAAPASAPVSGRTLS